MSREIQNEQIENYLLGDLSQREREQVEARYFSEPDFLERMDVIEEDLIEDYALGALGEERKGKVEQNLLNSPYQQEKAKFTGTLMRSVDEAAAAGLIPSRPALPRTAWWAALPSLFRARIAIGWAIPVAALLLLACGWLMVERGYLRRELEESRQELAASREREQELNEKIARQQKLIEQASDKQRNFGDDKRDDSRQEPAPQPRTTSIATFVLPPMLFRNVQEPLKELEIAPEVESVQLQLIYDGKDYPLYSVVLETAGGARFLPERSGLRAAEFGQEKRINYVIPASRLENRTYQALLRGVTASPPGDDLRRYAFKIKLK